MDVLITHNLSPLRPAWRRTPRRSEPAGKDLADANRGGTPSSLKNNRRAAPGAQRTRRTRMSGRRTRSLCHSPCRRRRDGRQHRRNDHHDRTSHDRRLHGRRLEHHRVPPSRRSVSRALPPLRVAVRICVPSKFSGKALVEREPVSPCRSGELYANVAAAKAFHQTSFREATLFFLECTMKVHHLPAADRAASDRNRSLNGLGCMHEPIITAVSGGALPTAASIATCWSGAFLYPTRNSCRPYPYQVDVR
jgi:hypothetical protein